jgi:capsid protein
MDAWKTYQVRRFRKAFNFCQPIYEEILADAVALGRFNLPGFLTDPIARAAWCGSKWSGDGMMALDPLKEASAAAKRIETGITTLPAETIAYDGGDWEANHKVSAKVQAERLKDGLVAPLAASMANGELSKDPDYSEDPEDLEGDDDDDDDESTEDRQ